MQIQDLAIPDTLKQQYLGLGILELYPPQATCVEKGLLDGKNLLVAIPTASGKTLIAEMAMHRHISNGGKCLYIVPLKALASEKYDEFGNKGVRVGISTGDLDRRDDALGKNDIIVATSEKVDSLLRNGARSIPEITLVVVDEVHLIDSRPGPDARDGDRKDAIQESLHATHRALGDDREPEDACRVARRGTGHKLVASRLTCARAFFTTTKSSSRREYGP